MKILMLTVALIAMGSSLMAEESVAGAFEQSVGQAAVPATPPKKKIFPVHPSKMAAFNAKTGGLVEPPANAKKVLILDARAMDVPVVSHFTVPAERMISIGFEVKRSPLDAAADLTKVAFDAKRGGAGAVIIFYERKDSPVLTAYPEDAIVLVNMTPLKCDDPKKFSRRFSKEFWRALGFALGGYGNVTQLKTVMQPVFSPEDLDAVNGFGLTPQQMVTISAFKAKLGIFGEHAVPYSRAAREGWAPAPTNDIQRALFNRFKDPTSRFKADFSK